MNALYRVYQHFTGKLPTAVAHVQCCVDVGHLLLCRYRPLTCMAYIVAPLNPLALCPLVPLCTICTRACSK